MTTTSVRYNLEMDLSYDRGNAYYIDALSSYIKNIDKHGSEADMLAFVSSEVMKHGPSVQISHLGCVKMEGVPLKPQNWTGITVNIHQFENEVILGENSEGEILEEFQGSEPIAVASDENKNPN